jgi:hypothetical protein
MVMTADEHMEREDFLWQRRARYLNAIADTSVLLTHDDEAPRVTAAAGSVHGACLARNMG